MGFDSGRGFTSAGSPVGGQGEIGGTLPTGTEGQILYFDGTTNLWTATSNVFIDDTNNRVGIGITSSLLAKLHVKSASGTALQVDGSSITGALTVLADGSVGIGTTTPAGVLTLYKDTSVTKNYLEFKNQFGTFSFFRTNGSFSLSSEGQSSIISFAGSGNYLEVSSAFGSTLLFGTAIRQDITGGGLQYNIAKYKITTNLSQYYKVNTIEINSAGADSSFVVGQYISKGSDFVNANTKFYPIIVKDGSSGFGTDNPNSSAIIDLTSTTQGFLPPRMTTAQRNAISSPAVGLMVFDTDLDLPVFYANNGGSPRWEDFTGTAV